MNDCETMFDTIVRSMSPYSARVGTTYILGEHCPMKSLLFELWVMDDSIDVCCCNHPTWTCQSGIASEVAFLSRVFVMREREEFITVRSQHKVTVAATLSVYFKCFWQCLQLARINEYLDRPGTFNIFDITGSLEACVPKAKAWKEFWMVNTLQKSARPKSSLRCLTIDIQLHKANLELKLLEDYLNIFEPYHL